MSLLLKHIKIKQVNSKYVTKFIYKRQVNVSHTHKNDI